MLTRTTVEDLKRIPLFRETTGDELWALSSALTERDYRKGEFVYQEEEVSGVLYIIEKGSVEITREMPTGHRQVVARLRAGQFFGELSFFEKRRHAARAQLLENGRMILLNKYAYDEMEKERPPLVYKLLREIFLGVSANLESRNDLLLRMIHHAFYGGRAETIDAFGEIGD
ncbi:MAG: cyclic nucleotide-binding domain-containing protein [Nitrospirae bacterium]|nr:cyclic nucleotide-binding domain-containing protein [Nitrospirota bacterium]